jgi:hypothetical protein
LPRVAPLAATLARPCFPAFVAQNRSPSTLFVGAHSANLRLFAFRCHSERVPFTFIGTTRNLLLPFVGALRSTGFSLWPLPS